MRFKAQKPGKGSMKNRFMSIWFVSTLVLTGILGIFIFESEIVNAAITIYVDDDNLGFEYGTITNPFNTIQEGVDAAGDGDTIFVFNGTYVENVEILNKSLSLIGEDKNTTIIDGEGGGNVIYATSHWNYYKSVNILSFTITNGSSGIEFEHVENCKIQNNIVTNNFEGIDIGPAHLINITENIVLNNYYGIKAGPGMFYNITGNTVLNNEEGIDMSMGLSSIIKGNTLDSNGDCGISIHLSVQIQIIDNHISFHNWYGIYISGSVALTLINNTMLNDGIYIDGGGLQEWNTHTIDTSNTVNGKPVYYWKNQTGGSIPPGGGQVILANCTNVTVEGHEFIYGTVGIELGHSSNCSIIGNNVSSNDLYGIITS